MRNKKKRSHIYLEEYEMKRGWRKVNYKEFDKLGIKTICQKVKAFPRYRLKIVSKEHVCKNNEFEHKRVPENYYMRKKGRIIELVPNKFGLKIRRYRLKNG